MYKNYIFDFYGTLVDIRTDEEMPALWKKMAELYSCYGADFKPHMLREEYLMLVHDEENMLREKNHVEYPEINLGRVFARLLLESPYNHFVSTSVCGRNVYDLRRTATSATINEIASSEWCVELASVFRILSRKKFCVYPHTLNVIRRIKRNGCGIYLLSNAQALFTDPEIEASGLKRYFDGIYISSIAGIRKPQKEFMAQLLKDHRLDPKDCVMVGNDFDTDIRIAEDNGMDSVFLNTFRYDDAELERRMKAVCHDGYMPRVIKSGDIRELLEESEEEHA